MKSVNSSQISFDMCFSDKQKRGYEVRISGWSSEVCASSLWHFGREGYSGRQTPDGEQALMLVEERVPDIVLLDWMIESLPGIEVCRRLRRNPKSANVPIIMLTARGEEEDRIRGLETGADDYVTDRKSTRLNSSH